MPDSASDLLVARRRKLEALRARGGALFPNDFVPSATTGELRARFGEMNAEALEEAKPEARIGGRIVGVRDFGKSAFFDLHDRSGRLQVNARRDDLGDDFETYRNA